jgi:DUF1365 family protein
VQVYVVEQRKTQAVVVSRLLQMNVAYVLAITQPVQTVQAKLMVMLQKTTAAYVIKMAVMTVYRIVKANGVEQLK